MCKPVKVHVILRRYDFEENPSEDLRQIELNPGLDYNNLKDNLRKLCDLQETDDKVLKIRNKEYFLIPLNCLLEANTENEPFYIDVSKVNYKNCTSTASPQDTYLNAVSKSLRNMETRVTQAEMLIPQLKWRRQAHMEQTISTLSSRVSFLNRRIDELMPPEWKSKMPQTMA